VGEPPGGDEEEEVASVATSGKPNPEVVKPPGGGEEEDAASMDTSDEPRPEMGEPSGGGEDDVASMATRSEPGPEAQSEKVQGTMLSGSPIGDDVSGKSSPAAKTDEIYSSSDKTTTRLSSRST
jgi:hypothetical protein